jgi:hypothetical protein
MNKSGPLNDGELSYENSGTGYIIDTYSIERPISTSDVNMKYFTNFNESDLIITFDNDTTSNLNVNDTSTCLTYSTLDDKLSTCVKEDLYNVIGRNYITVKAEYVEDPAYPNDIAEKYLYKGGDGVSIQTEDLDMSLRIINPLSQTFPPGTSGQTSSSTYDEIKYTLKTGSVKINNVQLENDPTSGSAYVYFKKDTNYFYIDDSNTLKMDGTSTDKQLFTLIQSNKDNDSDGTTYRIIRVGDETSGYSYATKDSSGDIVFKTQTEIDTKILWDNMNIGFKK